MVSRSVIAINIVTQNQVLLFLILHLKKHNSFEAYLINLIKTGKNIIKIK